jgi:hypothetical protein
MVSVRCKGAYYIKGFVLINRLKGTERVNVSQVMMAPGTAREELLPPALRFTEPIVTRAHLSQAPGIVSQSREAKATGHFGHAIRVARKIQAISLLACDAIMECARWCACGGTNALGSFCGATDYAKCRKPDQTRLVLLTTPNQKGASRWSSQRP